MPNHLKPRAFSYIRLSSEPQLKGHGLQRQLEASRAYAAEHGLDLAEGDELTDLGLSAYSGAHLREGALGKFLEAVRAGKVEKGSYLLIENLDRLSRQEVMKSLSLFLEIVNSGIFIVTLVDRKVFSESTDFNDLLISIVSMLRSHEESKTKSTRIRATWANKRKNAGSRPMTATCPGWLRLSADRTGYEVIEGRADLVVSIFRDCVAGIGAYSIARRLNQQSVPTFGRSKGWHQNVVQSILGNRAVLGHFQPHTTVDGKRVPDGDVIEDYFPRIVDDGLFWRAQETMGMRKGRNTGRKGAGISSIFSGLLTCSYCKGHVRFENKGPGVRGGTFLICDAAKRGLNCPATRWKYKDFETAFLSFCSEVDLESVIHTEDDARKLSNLQDTVAALRGEQASLKNQMDRVFELLNMGTATKYVGEKLAALEARRDAVDAELSERERELARTGMTRDLGVEELRSMIGRVQEGSGDEVFKLRSSLQSRLRSLVNVIHVAPHGHAPLVRRTIDFLRTQADTDDVIAHLERKLESEEEKRRYFSVGFRGNSVRIVFPEDGDPTRFHVQVTSSPDEGLVRRYPTHDEQMFVPKLDPSDLEKG